MFLLLVNLSLNNFHQTKREKKTNKSKKLNKINQKNILSWAFKRSRKQSEHTSFRNFAWIELTELALMKYFSKILQALNNFPVKV